MDKQRIQVYAEPEMKRRIELAAAKHNVAVTEYCLSAIVQQLADDELLEEEQVAIPVKQAKDKDLIADLRALREKILARRGGRPIDIDILEQVRAERDYELTGLH
jgi:uncharacterized protein (DUF1778 family)